MAKRALASVLQLATDEQQITDAELEADLEKRETLKAKAGKARKAYADIDAAARLALTDLDLGDESIVRCGRFRITTSPVDSRSVAFETEPTTRLTISVVKADEDD